MVRIMRHSLYFIVLVLVVSLTACDGTGPEATSESHFELTAGAPVNTSVEGRATGQ